MVRKREPPTNLMLETRKHVATEMALRVLSYSITYAYRLGLRTARACIS